MSTKSSSDVVLVTIDCLRHDAPNEMPNLRSLTEDGVWTEAIAPSSSTPWVSPALMQSRVFPDVLYDARGRDRKAYTRYSVDDSVPSLPRVLSAAGYSTGAFIAANPYLRQYADHFDTFWDGYDEAKFQGPLGPIRTRTSRLTRTVLLRKQVPGDELVDRAREWYETAAGPRFLWMHFMEPHFPYYPGLSRGRRVGLRNAYRASVRKFRSDDRVDDLPERDVRTLRDLYWECIGRVDEYLPDMFAFLDDDAVVALTGDHGEGFDHGWIGHVDIYDETVRVPLALVNVPESAYDGRTVRQLDVPATLLDATGRALPSSWDGVQISQNRPLEALLVVAASGRKRTTFFLGLRTDEQKLIRRYDFEKARYVESEYYDLMADPEETENRYDPEDPPDVKARLDQLIDESDLLEKLERFKKGHGVGSHPGVSEQVENRLAELGYT